MDRKDQEMRERLFDLLSGKGAHANWEQALYKLPLKYFGKKVKGLPYTIWQILEHMRLSQADILDYVKNPDYVEKDWPDDYWPKERSPANLKKVSSSKMRFKQDLEEVKALVLNPKTKILKPLFHLKEGHTLFRELLLIADHNAYHTGQIIVIRRLLGVWKD